jgi:hypothetical protein
MGYLHAYLSIVGFILIAHAPGIVENSPLHSLRLPSSQDMKVLVSRFTCRDELRKDPTNQGKSDLLLVACGASSMEAPNAAGADNAKGQNPLLNLRIPSGVENAFSHISQVPLAS